MHVHPCGQPLGSRPWSNLGHSPLTRLFHNLPASPQMGVALPPKPLVASSSGSWVSSWSWVRSVACCRSSAALFSSNSPRQMVAYLGLLPLAHLWYGSQVRLLPCAAAIAVFGLGREASGAVITPCGGVITKRGWCCFRERPGCLFGWPGLWLGALWVRFLERSRFEYILHSRFRSYLAC